MIHKTVLQNSLCTKNEVSYDLLTFTKETLNEKLHFLCGVSFLR